MPTLGRDRAIQRPCRLMSALTPIADGSGSTEIFTFLVMANTAGPNARPYCDNHSKSNGSQGKPELAEISHGRA